MNPALLFRALRRARRLSQRELAALTGVPRSTIDRVESGRTAKPTLRLVEDVVSAAGYCLIVVDNYGRQFDLDEVHARLRDRAGRKFPAHLETRRLEWTSRWWGWSRVWDIKDAPEWVHDRRSRIADDERWLDAT